MNVPRITGNFNAFKLMEKSGKTASGRLSHAFPVASSSYNVDIPVPKNFSALSKNIQAQVVDALDKMRQNRITQDSYIKLHEFI